MKIRDIHGQRVLWVASTGGHLEQLYRISQAIRHDSRSSWVTFDTPQARGLLQGLPVTFLPYIPPRGWLPAIKGFRAARRAIKFSEYDVCVSTGAAIAPPVLVQARLAQLNTIYIESVSRTEGPSISGRAMSRIPGVQTYTQHERWATARWRYAGSLLDAYSCETSAVTERPLKIFVTAGTMRTYRFDRMIDAVLSIIRPDDEVVWQIGCTGRTDLPGVVFEEMPSSRFRAHMEWADTVVTHAGVGSILPLLELGKLPVLAVRSNQFNEHVDSHQSQIAAAMRKRGLSRVMDLESPSRTDILVAASSRVRPLVASRPG